MRLYDASSCTPCCSNWENSTRQRHKALSFVPMSSVSTDVTPQPPSEDSTGNGEGSRDHGNEKPKQGIHGNNASGQQHQNLNNKSRYQYISKAPSNTTATTGDETPPIDNLRPRTHKQQTFSRLQVTAPESTTHSPSSGGRDRESARIVVLVDDVDDVGVDADTSTNDVESSCSTLTTTRSMKLQLQNQDLHISVASKCISTSRKFTHQATQAPLSILDLGPAAVQQVPIQRTGNIISSSDNNSHQRTAEDPSPPLSVASADVRSSQSPSSHWKLTTEGGKGMDSTIPFTKNSASDAPKRSTTPTFSQHSSQLSSLERNQHNQNEKDKPELIVNTTAPIQKDRIDFFPMHRPIPHKDTHNDEEAPRLGATSRFPSLGRQGIPSASSDGDCWTPFHDDGFDEKNMDVNNTSWVTFGDLQSSKDWIGFEWVAGESPVSFPSGEVEKIEAKDNSITALLEEHEVDAGRSYDYEENKENHEHLSSAFQDANQVGGKPPNIRKILAQGGGKSRKRRPRQDLQTPQLLGPLLEKRFTRSYWRRLRGAKGNSQRFTNSIPQVDMLDNAEATRQPEKNEKQHRSINHSPDLEGPALDSDWGDPAPYDEQEMFQSYQDDNNGFEPHSSGASPKLPSANGLGETSDTCDAKVLSPTRLRECHDVLDRVDLTQDELLAVIDTADASSALRKEQIMDLHRLIPTREERRLLLRYVKKSRRQATLLQISDMGESFMLQMIGVDKVQRKLAALLFQLEFPSLVQTLREGYRLLQSASDEILKSSKLEKVLGIINMLRNRLVGRTPGRRKTNKISLRLLKDLLAEAENSPENGVNEPFLFYACTRIQRTKPSLLQLKEELPSLHRVVEGRIKWDTLRLQLEALEARFEGFREFAISLSVNSHPSRTNDGAPMSVEDEIDLLQSTSVGSFAVDACLKMAEIYEAFDATQSSYDALVKLVVEERQEGEKPMMNAILTVFASFSAFVERFN